MPFASQKLIDESVARVSKHCPGPEHNNYYVVSDALSLALSQMTPVQHSRFRRLWKEFQSKQRKNGGSGSTIESFLLKKTNPSHATSRPPYQTG